jgi:hypothetical protein
MPVTGEVGDKANLLIKVKYQYRNNDATAKSDNQAGTSK